MTRQLVKFDPLVMVSQPVMVILQSARARVCTCPCVTAVMELVITVAVGDVTVLLCL